MKLMVLWLIFVSVCFGVMGYVGEHTEVVKHLYQIKAWLLLIGAIIIWEQQKGDS